MVDRICTICGTKDLGYALPKGSRSVMCVTCIIKERNELRLRRDKLENDLIAIGRAVVESLGISGSVDGFEPDDIRCLVEDCLALRAKADKVKERLNG